jgi:hypothetical protein
MRTCGTEKSRMFGVAELRAGLKQFDNDRSCGAAELRGGV